MAGDREGVGESAYSMYYGVSCAFLAVDLISKKRCIDFDRSRLGEMMLKGSAQLLGLLVERAQGRREALEKKLKQVEWELEELKRRRTEDAKANEKVVAIFAAHEQRWIAERKSLRLQIRELVNELQNVMSKHADAVSNLEERMEEAERAAALKDEVLEEEAKKRKELEEKLQLAQEVTDELTERAKKEAQDHSAELWKHKTAFVELVSEQRQTEAEMSRALRQAQNAKQELKEVHDQKQEAVATAEKLSEQIEKMQKNSEQKDKILSAMLRKSKLDTAERQMLLKEVKLSKAKKKQAELEMERWRNMWESSRNKTSREFHSVEIGSSQDQRRLELLPLEHSGHNSSNLILGDLEDEGRREDSSTNTAIKCYDHYSIDEHDEAAMDDYKHLQDWIRKETEKYASILEQKHYAEIEAFAEQMRQKDEKLEAFRWRDLSLELEAKRLKSHIEGLDGNISHLREDNDKLESILFVKDQEIKSLKGQLSFHVHQNLDRNNSNYFPGSDAPPALWSEFRITKEKENERPEHSRAYLSRETLEMDDQDDADSIEIMDKENNKTDSTELSSSSAKNFQEQSERANEMSSPEQPKSTETSISGNASEDQVKSITLISNPTDEEIEEKEVNSELQVSVQELNGRREVKIANELPLITSSLAKKDTSWKMDIQSLGISYKIKRLKQQLVVLEKLAAIGQTTNDDDTPITVPEESNGKKIDENRQQQIKSLLFLKSLLGKQLKRYQSLEEKADDLCRRMHESYRSGGRRELRNGRPREQTETLEHFLEETFQLQRYVVATGQKLMEINSMISPSFHGAIRLDDSVGFNMGQFADIIRTLFKEIQRGLEVRIARIIGDLEGTLACDGILHR